MKAFLAAIALLLVNLPAVAVAAPAYPPHSIPNSELRVLPRNAAGRHYQLSIGLPGSYSKETAKRYPVVYVTDGYWDFQKLEAIRGSLVFDKVVPEFIIVGLGYAGEGLDYGKLRAWELSPVPFGDAAGSGHAADSTPAAGSAGRRRRPTSSGLPGRTGRRAAHPR